MLGGQRRHSVSPDAEFEEYLQNARDAIHANGRPDPDGAEALQSAFHARAEAHARAVESAIQTCAANHFFCAYYVDDERRLHAAVA